MRKSLIRQSDASDRGLGAVLLQCNRVKNYPSIYALRKLNESERAYATVEK